LSPRLHRRVSDEPAPRKNQMMMPSRTAGKEPAQQIPSREEFLKLPDDQRNQINEAVSSQNRFAGDYY